MIRMEAVSGWNLRRRFVELATALAMTLSLLSVMSAVAPSTASAAWPEGCRLIKSTYHCYALSEWYMTQNGEEINGTQGDQYTTSMNVTNWASNSEAFVSNEEWTGWHPKGWWIEIGQLAGGTACCVLHIFYAHKTTGELEVFVATGRVEGYTLNPYFMKHNGNEKWCFYQGPKVEEVSCVTGVPNHANLLQIGAEAADNSKPENAGHDETNYTSLQGSVKPWKEDEFVHDKEMCVSRYTPSNFPGNINYGTC